MTPQPPSRMTMVALGVSVACTIYSGSLALQHYVPGIKDALMLSVDGVKPTYYSRVLLSLLVGIIAAVAGRHLAISERQLAWGTSLALGLSLLLACVFP